MVKIIDNNVQFPKAKIPEIINVVSKLDFNKCPPRSILTMTTVLDFNLSHSLVTINLYAYSTNSPLLKIYEYKVEFKKRK